MYTIGNPSVRLIDITTADCVHKTGDEIIEGVKTFTEQPVFQTPLFIPENSTVVTPDSSDDSNKIATTEWVRTHVSGLPIASVVPSMSDLTPFGFLHMNGDTFSVAAFPDLAKALGAPEGATTFTLPNGIGRVLWGSDTAGQYIEAGLPNIDGTMTIINGNGMWGVVSNDRVDSYNRSSGAFFATKGVYTQMVQTGQAIASGDIKLDASRSNQIYGNSTTVQPPALTVRFYIKAYDVAIPESQAQVAGLIDAVQGKVNLDGSNLTASTTVKTVVESGGDTTKWYRKWSDGWLEQGGVVNASQNSVTLAKSYSNNNYTITIGALVTANSNVFQNIPILRSASTASFNIATTGYLNCSMYYYCCGY